MRTSSILLPARALTLGSRERLGRSRRDLQRSRLTSTCAHHCNRAGSIRHTVRYRGRTSQGGRLVSHVLLVHMRSGPARTLPAASTPSASASKWASTTIPGRPRGRVVKRTFRRRAATPRRLATSRIRRGALKQLQLTSTRIRRGVFKHHRTMSLRTRSFLRHCGGVHCRASRSSPQSGLGTPLQAREPPHQFEQAPTSTPPLLRTAQPFSPVAPGRKSSDSPILSVSAAHSCSYERAGLLLEPKHRQGTHMHLHLLDRGGEYVTRWKKSCISAPLLSTWSSKLLLFLPEFASSRPCTRTLAPQRLEDPRNPQGPPPSNSIARTRRAPPLDELVLVDARP